MRALLVLVVGLGVLFQGFEYRRANREYEAVRRDIPADRSDHGAAQLGRVLYVVLIPMGAVFSLGGLYRLILGW